MHRVVTSRHTSDRSAATGLNTRRSSFGQIFQLENTKTPGVYYVAVHCRNQPPLEAADSLLPAAAKKTTPSHYTKILIAVTAEQAAGTHTKGKH